MAMKDFFFNFFFTSDRDFQSVFIYVYKENCVLATYNKGELLQLEIFIFV